MFGRLLFIASPRLGDKTRVKTQGDRTGWQDKGDNSRSDRVTRSDVGECGTCGSRPVPNVCDPPHLTPADLGTK
jgi:hypothetical protein